LSIQFINAIGMGARPGEKYFHSSFDSAVVSVKNINTIYETGATVGRGADRTAR
jgi:hypothetical protein